MNAPLAIDAGAGWQAELALGYVRRRGRTVLAERRHRGPLLVQRPFHPEGGDVCHTYLLHPPSGIVGGDTLKIALDLAEGAQVLVTTPAATKWYRSRGPLARLAQRATLAPGAALEWLPQENIVFDGARAALDSRLDVADGARYLGWELLCLGRPACGETHRAGGFEQATVVRGAGVPAVRERWRSRDGEAPGMRGYAVGGTLLAYVAGAAALAAARELCADFAAGIAGASLRRDWLVCRALAATVEPLRALLVALWSALRPLVLGRPAMAPRIWAT